MQLNSSFIKIKKIIKCSDKKYAYNKVQIKEFSEIKFNQSKFDLVAQATMLLLFKNNRRNILKCNSSFLIFDLEQLYTLIKLS